MPEVSKPFFSIITPVYNRVNDGKLKRCLDSVMTQTFEDFEHLTIDDGSTEDVSSVVDHYDERFQYITIEHQGRVVARNEGFSRAKGKFIAMLDSDDAWDPMYLATFTYYIEQFPEHHAFCAGAIVHGVKKSEEVGKHLVPVWTKIRHAWEPPPDPSGKYKSAIFTSGKVGTGMFVFSKEALDTIGLLPDWLHWEEVADGIDGYLGVPAGTTGYNRHTRLVGNPYGEDHCMYQKLAMHFDIKIIKAALYIHYVR